jgi:branched-subunit amino acid transport protein
MDDAQKVFIVILGMSLVTFALRFVPACFLSSWRFPPWVEAFLRYIPVAVLSAMVVPAILMSTDDKVHLGADNLFLLVSVPTVILAVWTRSFLTTVVAGVVFMAALRYFGLGMV